MAFSTRVATMPHDVAVPECSSDRRDLAGENNRKRLLVALEFRHRAPACGAKRHRHPTRTIPFPLPNRTELLDSEEGIRASPYSGNVPPEYVAAPCIDLQQFQITPTCSPEVPECA